MEEFKRGVAVFVTAVVLATGSPVMAQSSGLLASAERAALTMEVEQDETVVRRRRSGGLALTGGALAVAGVVLALRPPVCELRGRPPSDQSLSRTYEAALYRGQCDVKSTRLSGGRIDYRSVLADIAAWEDNDLSSVRKLTWNYVGWATAAAGGALMLFGLRGVEVPVRLDVVPTDGFRVSRSLGW